MQLESGQSLGRYVITGPFELEGLRDLYRATDTLVGREVAIHVVFRKSAESPGSDRAFERAARAAVRLAHPNIVTEFDVGHEGPLWYVAMEPLGGSTLRHRLAQGPLAIGDALAIAAQLASGLSYAHSVGVVHRGVSPESVLLGPNGRARLFDFVVVPPDSHHLSGAYSAPEILRGEAPDYRADQYSLGVVLHEMLTGTRPSEGVSGVPPEIAPIIVRCLSGKPDQRFASTTDLAQAIETLRPWPEPAAADDGLDAAPLRRPHPFRTVLAVAVVAAIVALGVAGAWRLVRPFVSDARPATTHVAESVPSVAR